MKALQILMVLAAILLAGCQPAAVTEITVTAEESVDADLHVSVAAGQSSTLDFTALEPGEYEYFCSVPGHKEAGMTGLLIVK